MVTEGPSLGLRGVGVCMGYFLSSIYASPSSALIKPIAEGAHAFEEKVDFCHLSGTYQGKCQE